MRMAASFLKPSAHSPRHISILSAAMIPNSVSNTDTGDTARLKGDVAESGNSFVQLDNSYAIKGRH